MKIKKILYYICRKSRDISEVSLVVSIPCIALMAFVALILAWDHAGYDLESVYPLRYIIYLTVIMLITAIIANFDFLFEEDE